MKQDERLIKQRIEENYNDANLEDLQKWIDEGDHQQTSYMLVDKGPASCKVKVSKKGQENLAKVILK
ncbi:MAG: hypothetical protein IJ358_03640 [Clostridia bacterium]|nr:hypothetical protein [Clostridia bacterium]